jgi:hypothetical protein
MKNQTKYLAAATLSTAPLLGCHTPSSQRDIDKTWNFPSNKAEAGYADLKAIQVQDRDYDLDGCRDSWVYDKSTGFLYGLKRDQEGFLKLVLTERDVKMHEWDVKKRDWDIDPLKTPTTKPTTQPDPSFVVDPNIEESPITQKKNFNKD